MINSFDDRQVRHGVISCALSSYGYDLRVADEFKIFTDVNSTIVDPKGFDARSLVEFSGPACIVPPNSFALAHSVEYFKIPRSVLTVCVGKSTYARCGKCVVASRFPRQHVIPAQAGILLQVDPRLRGGDVQRCGPVNLDAAS